MLGFHDHADAGCPRHFGDGVGDLLGQRLLDLQPAREHVHDAPHLGEPQDAPLGQIADVALADEGQQVVFAQGVQLDVLHQHDFVEVALEQRVVHDLFHVLGIAPGEEFERARRASGRGAKPLALGRLADADDQFAVGVGKRVRRRGFGRLGHARTRSPCPASPSARRALATAWNDPRPCGRRDRSSGCCRTGRRTRRATPRRRSSSPGSSRGRRS